MSEQVEINDVDWFGIAMDALRLQWPNATEDQHMLMTGWRNSLRGTATHATLERGPLFGSSFGPTHGQRCNVGSRHISPERNVSMSGPGHEPRARLPIPPTDR
jgi:hypothetical protein